MQQTRWYWLGISLVGAGVLIGWVSLLIGGRAWGVAEWGVLVGGLVALAGVIWFRRRISAVVVNLEDRQAELRRQQGQLREERREFEKQCEQLRGELESQAVAIDQRQSDLTRKLAVWHEWMEFPEPVDLSGESALQPHVWEAARDEALSDKDRQLNDLLEAQSKLLFENVLRNKYNPGGQFQPALLRNDAYALIGKVARIYRPHVQNPLLETSLEELLRAVSRACLHFLVVLETLPVKVQQYNVKSMYGWVKQGVKAYGVYKSAQPYLPFASGAYYLSRFAMGANPLTLLAWWATSQVATRTASGVTKWLVQQRSLALLQDVVRVIGYEVAGIYGGHLRRRDANWTYGVELTEMLSRFPLSRDSLAHGLAEVGSIQLLNEYDRIFLYRCLAAHKSAGTNQHSAISCLSGAQRHAVARRLERFFAANVHGKTTSRVDSWREGAQERLGVVIKLDEQAVAHSVAQQAADAARSLASFLLAVKQIEPQQLDRWLGACRVQAHLDEHRYNDLLDQWLHDPPPFFEEPNLDPDGELAEEYLDDLMQLAARCPPHNLPLESLLFDVGAYLRRDTPRIEKLLGKQFVKTFRQRCTDDAVRTTPPPDVARAALWYLEAGEQIRFAYEGATRRGQGASAPPTAESPRDWWLVGTDQRMFVVEPGEIPMLVWLADATAEIQPDDGRLVGGCLLRGGTWLDGEESADDAVHLRGQTLRRYESYFGPLLAFGKPVARTS